jgi:hypothetical protein
MKSKLLIFKNCNAIEKYREWEITHTPILQKNGIESGINTLCFLGVFTKEVAEHFTKNVVAVNTSFIELMYYLKELSFITADYTEIFNTIQTVENLTMFLDELYSAMPNNSCTIANMNRQTGNANNVIIFSKIYDKLYIIDAQNHQMLERYMPSAEGDMEDDAMIVDGDVLPVKNSDNEIYEKLRQISVISISIILSNATNLTSKTSSPTYIIADFPVINKINLLQWEITTKQEKMWKCVDPYKKQNKQDCVVNSMTFFNLIDKKYAKFLSIDTDIRENGFNAEAIRNYLNKIKIPKTIIVYKELDNREDLINLLERDLQSNHGSFFLGYNMRTQFYHMTIVKKEKDGTYKMIDPQDESSMNLSEYLSKYNVTNHMLVYSVGLYDIDDPYLKTKQIKMKTMNKTMKKRKTFSQREQERNERILQAERSRMFSDIKSTFSKKTKKQLVKLKRSEMIDEKRRLVTFGKRRSKLITNKDKRQSDFERNRKVRFTFSPPLIDTVPIDLTHKLLLDNPETK